MQPGDKKRKKPGRNPRLFPLRRVLRQQGVSLRELARLTGIRREQLTKIRMGDHPPSWRTAARIAAALQASLGDFDPNPRLRAKLPVIR